MNKYKIDYKPRELCTPEEVRKGKIYDMHGYQEITGHFVFDVNIYFTRKARFAANGSKADAPIELTYSSIVSRNIVRP